MAEVLGSENAAVEGPATEQDKNKSHRATVPGEDFTASAGLPASPGQLVPGSSKLKGAQRFSKIPSPEALSKSSSQARTTNFPSDPLGSTGSASALEKIRAAREAAAGVSASPVDVASTISKAKEALAQARARAAAAGGSLHPRVSSRVIDGAVSDKPFTLYGKVQLPAPRAAVQIHPPDAEEAARRKAWQAEKETLRQRRLQQEAAAKEREAAAKAAAAAARAEEHKKRVEERKARYEAFKAREAEMLAKSAAAWQQYQQQRGRPPLYKTMEDEYLARQAADQEARRAAYEEEVAAAKLATVSQLVSGEVVIKPPAGGVSPGRSRSPGALNRSPQGSGDHSQALLSRRSPGRGGSLAASWSGAVGGGRRWPAAGPPRHLQLVERASSPLVLPADGSLPPGMKVIPTRLARQEASSNTTHDSGGDSEHHSTPAAAFACEQEQSLHMQEQHSAGSPAARSEADSEQHTHKPADRHTSRRSSVQHPQAVASAGEGGEAAEAHGAELHSGATHSRRQSGKAGAQQNATHTASAAAAGKQTQGHGGTTDQPAAGANEDGAGDPAAQVGAACEDDPKHTTAQDEDPGNAAAESELEEEEGACVASEGSAAASGDEEQEGGDEEASDVEASEGIEAAGSDEAGGAGSRRLSGTEAEAQDVEEAVVLAAGAAEQEEVQEPKGGSSEHRGSGDGEEVAEDIQ